MYLNESSFKGAGTYRRILIGTVESRWDIVSRMNATDTKFSIHILYRPTAGIVSISIFESTITGENFFWKALSQTKWQYVGSLFRG